MVSDEILTVSVPSSGAPVDLSERQDGYDVPEEGSSLRPAPVQQQALAGNDQDAAVRTTVYSDARIEEYLYEIRVQAAVARLDLTQSAVWRWAMARLIETHTPLQVIEHFIAEPPEQGRVGRPRR